jgi:protein ImuB
MRRVACIALPQIRVEIAENRHPSYSGDEPLGVVVARPGGAIRTEHDILGNTRLEVVSREAHALGVRPGQTVAAARANCSKLRVRVVAEEAVRAALERIGEVALAFGTTVAFDVVDDVVWVEIGGSAHLFGGEPGLARALAERVRGLGHACRVSIADGPRIASAIARFAPAARAESGMRAWDPLVVPEGKGAFAMRALPVAALALDDELTRWLVDLGLSTCGELQLLPRRSLGARLGPRAHDVIALLCGEDRTPLVPWRPAEDPEERVEFEWGVSSVEALVFVMRALCERLAARLAGRAMAAARIGLELALDRALLPPGASPVTRIDLALPAPIVRAADLFGVVRTRLERLELAAPVLAVALRALDLAPAPARPLDLLTPEPKAERALPRLVAELMADLGGPCIGTLVLVDTLAPDERTRLMPFGAPDASRRKRSLLVTTALEPSRLVPPVGLSLESISGSVLLTRVEAVEWWRRLGPRRDFVAAWLPAKRAPDQGAVAWVEMGELEHGGHGGQGWLRGWID